MLSGDDFPNSVKQWDKWSPTLPKIIAGMLEACMVVTTDMGVRGEMRTINRPK